MGRSLSSQVGILTLGRILAYAVMFFVPMVNVRRLSIDDYGIYRQFWLIFETISVILILSFPQSLFYYLPRAENKKEKSIYISQTVVFLIIMGFVSWGVYGLVHVILGHGLGGVVKQHFWRFCTFTLFMMVSRYMDSVFVAERNPGRQSIYHLTAQSMQACVIIITAWTTRSVEMVIWALTLFAFVKFMFAIIYAASAYNLSIRRMSLRSIREQLSYAIPLGMAAIALVLMTQTDKFIISYYLGSAGFAIYAIGAFQIPFLNIIRTSINSVVFPTMAQYQKEGRNEAIVDLWQRATYKTAVLFFPVFVFLEIAAGPFIRTLFTEAYSAAVPIFSIYLLLFLRSTIETGSVLMVFKKNVYLFKVFLCGFVVHIGLSIFLYNQFGRLGVPISTATVFYAINVVNITRVSRMLEISVFKILPWVRMAKVFLVAVVPGVPLWFYFSHRYAGYIFRKDDFIMNFAELASYGVLYLTIYGLLTWRLGFFTWRDVMAVFGRAEVVLEDED